MVKKVRTMTKIKICGLTRPCDIEAVNEALPDYAGFVFAESRRRIAPQEAARLKSMLDGRIAAVGVFVDEDPRKVAEICRNGIIDIIQLHGREDGEYIRILRTMTDKPVIKAVRVRSREDIAAAERLSCEWLLLDAYSDKKAGGTGTAFDWSLAGHIGKPFFLAGGLNSGNICKAVETAKPYGVDISSGVETDGYKDRGKILSIVRIVRSCSDHEAAARKGVDNE